MKIAKKKKINENVHLTDFSPGHPQSTLHSRFVAIELLATKISRIFGSQEAFDKIKLPVGVETRSDQY
jgi:hypothetical protein